MKERQPSSGNVNIFFPFSTRKNTRGWRRWLNVILRRIGLSWRFSPVRRVIQFIFLLLFLHLFFQSAWPYAKVFSSTTLSDREWLPVEFFLWLDPLVGVAASIAGRYWSVALLGTVGILLACTLFPRGFCGYVCPLGTLVDGFDWLMGRHFRRLHFKRTGWWLYLRYYVLAVVLIASVFGLLLTGYLAAIPVLTRGLLFTGARLQLGLMKNWSLVGPVAWTFYLSIALFAAIFLPGLFRRRFWCSYVCPSGALFSLFNFLRIGERKVESTCIGCGKCVESCPFDAIKEDFTTRSLNCTFCQTCGGACPTHAIKFVSRWNNYDLKTEDNPPVIERGVSRRGFILSAAVGVTVATGMRTGLVDAFQTKRRLVRPPGSLPEPQFLDSCVRCGECIKVCPGPVLYPAGIEGGWEAIWTPKAVLSRAGCHQDCNFCTQVCPTGAIRPLSIDQKRKTHMGLAAINVNNCLPHSGERDCHLCFQECQSAGYNAIEMRQIELDVGEIPPEAMPGFGFDSHRARMEMARIQAPFVKRDACVGCGLCEYSCHKAYVKQEKIFRRSAIIVKPENADK